VLCAAAPAALEVELQQLAQQTLVVAAEVQQLVDLKVDNLEALEL
jgi:hypothetical protein